MLSKSHALDTENRAFSKKLIRKSTTKSYVLFLATVYDPLLTNCFWAIIYFFKVQSVQNLRFKNNSSRLAVFRNKLAFNKTAWPAEASRLIDSFQFVHLPFSEQKVRSYLLGIVSLPKIRGPYTRDRTLFVQVKQNKRKQCAVRNCIEISHDFLCVSVRLCYFGVLIYIKFIFFGHGNDILKRNIISV